MTSKPQTAHRKPVYRGDPLTAPPPAELAVIIERHKGVPDALITAMEDVQRHYGYLAADHLSYLSRGLGFPLARLYGIATFYNFFRLTPPGEHVVRVCRGTACHVNQSSEILDDLAGRLAVDVGGTTDDGRFTLLTVACVGACSLAPVIVVDDATHGRVTPTELWETLAALNETANEGAPAAHAEEAA